LKLTTNPVRIVLSSKNERDDRMQEERYGSRKNEWNQYTKEERNESIYMNAEAVVQFCILHSVSYFPNVPSFSKPRL
jgi:hypothetical protein